jgi:hypothetical protein
MSESGSQSHYDDLDYSPYQLPGSDGETEYDFAKENGIVDRPTFSRFLQERRVKNMQSDIEDLELPWPETSAPGELDLVEAVDNRHKVQYHLLETSKTTTVVLEEMLGMVCNLQKRLRSAEERVHSLEAELCKSPAPKTSCGFSCSNNSVTID